MLVILIAHDICTSMLFEGFTTVFNHMVKEGYNISHISTDILLQYFISEMKVKINEKRCNLSPHICCFLA